MPILDKLMEECGELIQIAAKKSAYPDTDEHPDGKGSMKKRLEEEAADVLAAIDCTQEVFGLDEQVIADRKRMKLERFRRWFSNPVPPEIARVERQKRLRSQQNAPTEVVVDGVSLTTGQVMALRAALKRFEVDMSDHGALGCDGNGEMLRAGYLTQVRSVLVLLAGLDQS